MLSKIRGKTLVAETPSSLNGRSRRVLLLLVGIVVLSLADLLVTLAHMRIGMMEANPIVVYLMRATESPLILVAYKGLTVGICVSLLYRLRRHLEGEVAAWVALAILTVMSVMWHCYSAEFEAREDILLAQGGVIDSDHWLVLD